jgi:hypothetical protein
VEVEHDKQLLEKIHFDLNDQPPLACACLVVFATDVLS